MLTFRLSYDGLAAVALVAGPAEVLDRRGGAGEAVDLLPGVPAHVAEVDVVRARPDREAVRVAQAVAHDPARVRVGARRRSGCPACAAPVSGFTRSDRAVEGRRVGRRADVLAAQGAALGGRRASCAAHAAGRIPAGVERVAVLPVVGEVEARAVPAPT